MTIANYAIDWQAVVSGVSSGGTGVWVVTGPTSYVPATTANYTASPAIHGVLLSTVVNGVAPVQFNGPVPNTVTGFSASATGFARLNLVTGMAEFVAAYSSTDIRLGPVTYGSLRIDFSGDSASGGGYSPLIATELDENAADNSAALTAFCNRVDSGHKGIIPDGTYYFTETAYGLYENGFRGVSIEGESGGPDSGTGGVKFVWNGARVTGSAASLTCLFKGVADAVYTATHFDYVRLSGITGATAAMVGKRILVGNTARSYWAQIAVVVAVESATSVVLGMYWASSNTSIVGNTDANNGAITWEVLSPLWSIRGRDLAIRGIQFLTTGVANKPSSLLEWSQTDDSGVATNIELDNCLFSSNDTLSRARLCIDVGRVTLPTSASPYYLLEGGYRRPFVPYQCDYLRMSGCNFFYNEAGIGGGNTTLQERANSIYACNFVLMDFGVRVTSWFTNAAEQILRPGSSQFDFLHCTGGAIADTFLTIANPNAQCSLTGCYFEGILYRLAVCDLIGGTAFRPLIIRDCFFAPEGFATHTTGWLKWVNGPVTISGTTIFPAAPQTGFKIVTYSANLAKTNVINCVLPADADIGANLFQFYGVDGVVSRRDCVEWDTGSGSMKLLPDLDIVSPGYVTTQGGKYLQKVLGLSATWDKTNNLAGTATVTGAATTAVLTFPTVESSATGLYAWASPIASTGGPAANSNIPLTVVCTTTTATVTVMAAPGGAATVTFAIFLARGL